MLRSADVCSTWCSTTAVVHLPHQMLGGVESEGCRRGRDAMRGGRGGGGGREALEGKGPQRWPQQRLGRRSEEVAEAVGGGYCWLQMPLRLALGVGVTVAGHRQGALKGGVVPPPLPMHPWGGGTCEQRHGSPTLTYQNYAPPLSGHKPWVRVSLPQYRSEPTRR